MNETSQSPLPESSVHQWGKTEAEQHWLSKTQAQLRAASPPFDVERGWRDMNVRIAAEEGWKKNTVHTQGGRLTPWRQSIVGLSAGFAAGAFSAALLVLMLLRPQQQWPSQNVEPMSGPTSAQLNDTRVIDVIFKEGTTLNQVQMILQKVGGHVVSGPTALGVWGVSVPSRRAEKIVAELRSTPWIQHTSLRP
jgi:hypothetical protein